MNVDELNESIQLWLQYDPKCPGCGAVHPRERVGRSLTFVVTLDRCHRKGNVPKCKYGTGKKGEFIPDKAFKKGDLVRKDEE